LGSDLKKKERKNPEKEGTKKKAPTENGFACFPRLSPSPSVFFAKKEDFVVIDLFDYKHL